MGQPQWLGRPQQPRRWDMERELPCRLMPSLPALSAVSSGWPERACSQSAVLPVLSYPHAHVHAHVHVLD
eukprot:scaffold47993_cov56-Phaeocystis_antarctica.AAC.5